MGYILLRKVDNKYTLEFLKNAMFFHDYDEKNVKKELENYEIIDKDLK